MKRIAWWLCLGLLCSQAMAWRVQDDRGRSVELVQAPQRIVSILPSLTEMVCALDQCQRLVGVDRYASWPASVRQLPQVGGGLDPHIEAIVALRPDLVLAAASTRVTDRLWDLGIPVLSLEPQNHADVQRAFEMLGTVLGVADAPRLWRQIDAAVSAAAQSLPPETRQTRVYFEVNQGPYGASESSFIGETLTRLGVRNIVPSRLGAFPQLNPEFVVRANPDVIMVVESSANEFMQRPGWRNLKAVREGRVCTFNPAESDVLVRPGPRLHEAARLMARCLADKAPRTVVKASAKEAKP